MHQLQRIYVRRPWIGTRQARTSVFNIYRPCFQTHHHLRTNPAKQYSTTPEAPFKIPPTQLGNKTHPLGWDGIQTQVEPYFDINWKFASEKEKKGFFSLGLSRAFSNSFPLTLDERVGLTCKMFYFSLLIDGKICKEIGRHHLLTRG
jgi:aristolochene synthase